MRRVYDARPGDYVLCCKYDDHKNEDQWQVGFIDRVEFALGESVFIMHNKQRSYFKVCFLITPDEGDEIIKNEGPSSMEENGRPKYAYKGIIE